MKRILCLILILTLSYNYVFCQKAKKSKKSSSKNDTELFVSLEQYRDQSNTLLEAVKERLSGNLSQAEILLRNLIQSNPKYDLAYFEYAKILLLKNKTTEAISALNTAISINDTNYWFKILLAESYDAIGQFSQSEKLWKEIANAKPDNQEYLFKYAIALIYQNKLRDAISAYDQMELHMGVSKDITDAKRNIWLKLNRVDNAAHEMEKLANAYPNEPQYLIDIADMYIHHEMSEKAMPYLQKALQLDSTNPYINVSLYNYYVENKKTNDAFKYLKGAYASPELSVDEKIRIVLSFYNDKNHQDIAFELLHILVRTHPDEAKVWSVYGDFLYKNDSLSAAASAYEKALTLDETKYPIWQQYLTILLQLGRTQDLYQQSHTAITVFPSQPYSYLLKAMAALELEFYQETIYTLEEGRKYNYNYLSDEAGFDFLEASAYNKLEMMDSAIFYYDKAVQKQADNALYLNGYAYSLAEHDTLLDKALQMSEKANKIENNSAAYQDTHAWIYYKKADLKNARIWIEKALHNQGDKDIDILEHYAAILDALGDKEALEKCQQQINLLRQE